MITFLAFLCVFIIGVAVGFYAAVNCVAAALKAKNSSLLASLKKMPS